MVMIIGQEGLELLVGADVIQDTLIARRSGGAIAAPPAANIRSKQRADNNSLSELSLSLAASLQAAGIH